MMNVNLGGMGVEVKELIKQIEEKDCNYAYGVLAMLDINSSKSIKSIDDIIDICSAIMRKTGENLK